MAGVINGIGIACVSSSVPPQAVAMRAAIGRAASASSEPSNGTKVRLGIVSYSFDHLFNSYSPACFLAVPMPLCTGAPCYHMATGRAVVRSAETVGIEEDAMAVKQATSLVAQKVSQTQAVLREMGIDCWLVQFAQETGLHPDPVQPMLIDTDVTWRSAF